MIMFKRKMKRGILILFLILLVFPLINSDVQTILDVPESPPIFLNPIPNQSWPYNWDHVNAFDLYDYFYSSLYNNLTFWNSPVQNISIGIINVNGTANVSFYPDLDFRGLRTVTFYASDGAANVSSNLVYLSVGLDNESPQWYYPEINRRTVYQNDYIDFETLWIDNLELQNFTFLVDQEGVWSAYIGTLSGKVDYSRYNLQIRAAPDTLVFWRFCAFDTNLNTNCTDLQNFTVSARPTPPSGIGDIATGPSGDTSIAEYEIGGLIFTYQRKKKQFNVEPDYFKVSLKPGFSETRVLRITNLGDSELFLNISLSNLGNFAYLSNEYVKIPIGGKREIAVDFEAKKGVSAGQYFGSILVYSREINELVDTPVLIEINPLELDFEVDVEIFEDSKKVRAGEDVFANVSIINLRDIKPTNLSLYTAIKDFQGNIYDFSEEEILFISSLELERSLTTSLEMVEGDYIFYARVSDNGNISIDSDTFEIGRGFSWAAGLRSSFIFILIILLVVFLLILVVAHRRERRREKLLGLYLMLTQLKKLIKQGKVEQATELYIRIKRAYGEPVARGTLKNKEKLKLEIKALSDKLNEEVTSIKPIVATKPAAAKPVTNPASVAAKPDAELGAKPAVAKATVTKPVTNPASVKPAAKPKPSLEPAPATKPADNSKKPDIKK